MASDLVLIPVQPSPYDVWAATETVQLIREAQTFRPDIKSAFVINRKITNTAIGRDVTAALAQFEDVPVLEASLTQRVIYAESAGQGLAVIEVNESSEGAREILRLARAVHPTKERKAA